MSTVAIKPRKVGIIGAGHVGSHVAFAMALLGVADEIYLADIDVEKAKSQALDIQDTVSYLPHRVQAFWCPVNDLSPCDVIVLTVGPQPVPMEDRLFTLPETMALLDDVIVRLKADVVDKFQGVLLCISNPADVIAAYMQRALGLPARRVMCTGTGLDSARLQSILARELKGNVHPRSLNTAYMIGEHGNSCIVAWSHITIGAQSLTKLQQANPERYPTFDRDAMQDEVHERAHHVVHGKGSTEFGIGTTAAEITRAILHNEQKVLPCSVLLDGQYGEHNVYASLPVVVGAQGVEDIIVLDLTPEEEKGFHDSCDIIRSYIDKAIAIRPL